MSRRPTIPTISSSALRMRRLRDRARGQTSGGFAAISYDAALEVRRAMFANFRGRDVYGAGVTRAIQRAMHRLVRDAAPGSDDPVGTMLRVAGGYQPPDHPVAFLNRELAETLGPDLELGVPDPVAGR